jgi:DNA-binding Xre family transcriptional regulator
MYYYAYVNRYISIGLLTLVKGVRILVPMIACTLKEVLKKKGWSVYRLQKKSSITYPTLLALVHGRTQRYSGDVLSRICYALNCRPADLLKWSPDRFPRLKRPAK